MCDYSNGIRLCSCNATDIRMREPEVVRQTHRGLETVPNKRNAKIPLIPIWRLYRYGGSSDSYEIGRYLAPDSNLGNGLQEADIEKQLNAENCFDFDYVPQEGDNLRIQYNIRGATPYLSFIFREGRWITDHYSPFSDETLHLFDGIIRNAE